MISGLHSPKSARNIVADRGGGGHSLYMFNGGLDYGWTAGDDDATAYAPHACVEPVLQRPQQPKFGHMQRLYGVLRQHTALLLGQPPPQVQRKNGLEVYSYHNSTGALSFVTNGQGKPATYTHGRSSISVPAGGTILVSERGGAATLAFDSEACGECDNPQGIGAVQTVVELSNWSAAAEPVGARLDTRPGLGDMVQANQRTSDFAWYTTTLSAAQSSALLSLTPSETVITARVFGETAAYVFVDHVFVATLDNTRHNDKAKNMSAPLATSLRTASNVSILASCVGLSADEADVGDVGRAGVSAVTTVGGVDATANTWRMQPRLGGEASTLDSLQWHASADTSVGEGDCAGFANKSDVECLGLRHAAAGDASADACRRQCCDAARSCGVWQWAPLSCPKVDGPCGCWLGASCADSQKNPGGIWVGAAKPSATSQAKPTWASVSFDLPHGSLEPGLPLALDLGAAGVEMKGHAQLNGFDLGRFWVGPPPLTLQRFFQLPPDHLRSEGNTLVVFDELGGVTRGGLHGARVVKGRTTGARGALSE